MRRRNALLLGLIGLGWSCSSGGGSGFDAGSGVDAAGDVSTLDAPFNPNDGSLFPDTGGPPPPPSDAAVEASFDFDGFGGGDGNTCFDDDGDGWTTCDGDCDDHNALINPCAFDTNAASGDPVGSDGLDNDCDGMVDNLRVCDGSLTAGHDTNAADYASAMDACNNQKCTLVQSAVFYGPNDTYAHRITAHMGKSFAPRLGSYMTFLSNGTADDDIDTTTYRPGDGTDLLNTFGNPDPLKAINNVNPCGTGMDEPLTVHDYTELRLTVTAPVNAGSFSFDFDFFSEEYPEYVCHGFNDTFLAELTSVKYPTPYQIAFDGSGHRINVNNSYFQDCNAVTSGLGLGYTHTCSGSFSLLGSTGYDYEYGQDAYTLGNDNIGSGATDWLTTTAPINPGETFTLSLIIFDQGDGLMDSAINLDNWRWHSTTLGSPVTAR